MALRRRMVADTTEGGAELGKHTWKRVDTAAADVSGHDIVSS